jgi:L-Ala-D/L-Glu epimerase
LNLALHAPFGIAGGVQAKVENVLLTVELDDGMIGYGEAAPLPAYNGETQAQALTVLDGARAWLPGLQLDDWRAAATEFRHRGGATCGSAQCAFETAVLDALARRRGEPLWRFFGGAGVTLETDMTITTGTPEAAAEAARTIVARGFRMVKVKIGGAGPRHDLARLQAIVEAVGDVPLILDGNAGLTRAEADDLVRGLKDSGIAPTLLEQWLPKEDLVGLHDLAEHSGWAVAADESVVTREDALQVAHGQAAQVINVKLMKAGIAVALDVVEVARTAGLAWPRASAAFVMLTWIRRCFWPRIRSSGACATTVERCLWPTSRPAMESARGRKGLSSPVRRSIPHSPLRRRRFRARVRRRDRSPRGWGPGRATARVRLDNRR